MTGTRVPSMFAPLDTAMMTTATAMLLREMATQSRQGRRGASGPQAVLAGIALMGFGSFGLISGNTLDQAAADPATPAYDRSDQWPITECGTSNGRGCAPTGKRVDLQRPIFSNPTTITNLPFDANGQLIPSRSLPRGGGFGIANGYQAPRTVQLQIRYSF